MENPYLQAMIQGRVVAMEHEGAEENIDAMAKKYMDLDSYPYRQGRRAARDRQDRARKNRAHGIGDSQRLLDEDRER